MHTCFHAAQSFLDSQAQTSSEGTRSVKENDGLASLLCVFKQLSICRSTAQQDGALQPEPGVAGCLTSSGISQAPLAAVPVMQDNKIALLYWAASSNPEVLISEATWQGHLLGIVNCLHGQRTFCGHLCQRLSCDPNGDNNCTRLCPFTLAPIFKTSLDLL